MNLSEDALVAVCLCTTLGRGARIEPLNVEQWSDLVRNITRDKQATPRDLLDGDATALGLDATVAARVVALLRGLGSVGIEVERLDATGIWILTRGDADYPVAWKRNLGAAAPPVLFGAGVKAALSAGQDAVLIPTESLERTVARKTVRESILAGELTVVTPSIPSARTTQDESRRLQEAL